MIGTLFEDDRCMLLLLLFAVLSKVLVLFSTRARFVLFLFISQQKYLLTSSELLNLALASFGRIFLGPRAC